MQDPDNAVNSRLQIRIRVIFRRTGSSLERAGSGSASKYRNFQGAK
jgi:hypothetical protein